MFVGSKRTTSQQTPTPWAFLIIPQKRGGTRRRFPRVEVLLTSLLCHPVCETKV